MINYGEYLICLYVSYYLDSSIEILSIEIAMKHAIEEFFINGTEIEERSNLSLFIYWVFTCLFTQNTAMFLITNCFTHPWGFLGQVIKLKNTNYNQRNLGIM